MQNLQNSNFVDMCVFKGGTSLSKCYPGSINRFSEDIDLTFIPTNVMSNKQYDKALKSVEDAITHGFQIEKIKEERSDRNKSSYIWPKFENRDNCQIKLEIGSLVRPDPFTKRQMKTYIQEYLELQEMNDIIMEYDLKAVSINTLDITRTFLDKILSVKRHAICGTLDGKVRHIYDVTVLFEREHIQSFLNDFVELKKLLSLTKETDSFYLEKRNIEEKYNPTDLFRFENWKDRFDERIKNRYEKLHEDLLYTSEKQDFDKAIQTFETISNIFSEIQE